MGRSSFRLGVLAIVMAIVCGVVVVRLVQLQVLDDQRYVALGQSQRVRAAELAAERGSILDRNGVELVLSVPRRTIWADPRLVYDAAGYAQALAPILGLDPEGTEALRARLARDAKFVYVARKVADSTAAQIEALELPGLGFLDESARLLPGGDLARSLLGKVDVDNVGISGIEALYDAVLTGVKGELLVERDQNGRTIPVGEYHLKPADPGDDLVLTIDRSLQFAAEEVLQRAVTAHGALGAMAIVSDLNTGDILAMANITNELPTDVAPGQPIIPIGPAVSSANRAVVDVFEPGSVNKVITVAAAIEEGLVDPSTVLAVPDRLQVSDHEFSDHDPHPIEQWSVTDILTLSSNIGTIMLGQQLGKERLDEYLRAFGLGAKTALGFPGESAGILPSVEHWSGTSIGTIPIGQGVSVTALQMLQVFNVIATGGEYVAPRLVAATVDGDGQRHDAPAAERRRVLSESTARQVNEMLQEVVRIGTGMKAAIPGYSVAGKTGTPRKPQPGGGYKDGAGNYHYMQTFAGFVPAEEPRISIIVVVDEASTSIYASQVAAPIFKELAQLVVRQLDIPPAAPAELSATPSTTVAAHDGPTLGDRADAG